MSAPRCLTAWLHLAPNFAQSLNLLFMLNRSLRFDRLNAGLPRASRAGILSCTRGFRSYRLTRWPELASAQKYAFDGAVWEPDARAANQVFAAYRVPKLRYGLRDGLLCEMETGQGVMPGLLSDATDEVEQQAFCRVDSNGGSLRKRSRTK